MQDDTHVKFFVVNVLCLLGNSPRPHTQFNPCSAEFFYKNLGGQRVFFQFEIIINVLVRSFRFIWIPMLWVYGHEKYVYSHSAGIDFSRQNLTSTFWRLKSIRRQILTTKVHLRTVRVNQCCYNAGLPSETLAQHYKSTDSTARWVSQNLIL